MLGDSHCLRHSESQLTCGLLLQCRCSERRSRRSLQRFLANSIRLELSLLTLVEESQHFVATFKPSRQFGLHFRHCPILVLHGKDGIDSVIRLALEILYFPFTLNDKSDGNTLHTTGGESRFNLAPQYR